MDSLEWSKKFDVLSISRLVLRDELGFTTEQITLLTDDDLQAIADSVQEELSKAVSGFRSHLQFIVSLYLAEKDTDVQTGARDGKNNEPL